MPPDPAPPDPPAPPERGRAVRQVLLGAVVFIATLLLLYGLSRAVGVSGGATPGPSASPIPSPAASVRPSIPPSPSAAATPAPTPAGSAAATSTPPSADDPVLVGAGDIALCESDRDDATAALIDGIDGTVFTAGDNAYESGTEEQFRDCYGPSWGRFRDRTYPSAGNHDWETRDLAGYRAYFGERAGPPDRSWYGYDLGAWHVVVLDSECDKVGGCDAASPQGRWLAADLAASDARCTIAIWHIPRFSSGEHGNDTSVAPFWDALYAGGADLIVNGHDHDYERFAPQDPAGREDRTRGIREFVIGTGGAELRAFRESVPNSELRLSVWHGVLKLTLHATSYEWRFIPTEGDINDSGSGPCH